MKVDLKSVLLGMVLILALFIVIGQTTKQSYPVGRFQIVMPQTDTDNFNRPLLFDTKTGKTWRMDRYIKADKFSLNWGMIHFGNPYDSLEEKIELDNYYKVLTGY